jgi:hypothetical protein
MAWSGQRRRQKRDSGLLIARKRDFSGCVPCMSTLSTWPREPPGGVQISYFYDEKPALPVRLEFTPPYAKMVRAVPISLLRCTTFHAGLRIAKRRGMI